MKKLSTLVLSVLLLAPVLAAAADKMSAPDPTVPATTRALQKKLDLNRASREELVTVPGIGPRMAQAIIDLRSKTGSFRRMEDLLNVTGIKEKKLAAIAVYLDVVAPQVSTSAAAASPK